MMGQPADKLTARGAAREDAPESVLTGVQKQILTMFCWCLLQNGKVKTVIPLLNVLHQIDPQRTDIMMMLCYSSLEIADYAQALSLSVRLADLGTRDRDIITANLFKSRALHGLGRQDEARVLMIETINRKRKHDDQSVE